MFHDVGGAGHATGRGDGLLHSLRAIWEGTQVCAVVDQNVPKTISSQAVEGVIAASSLRLHHKLYPFFY